jgi:hypothetical protein
MRNGIPHCIRIGFNGKNYQVHRIIWTLLFGKIPSDHIVDHADGNPFNNKLNNLRVIHSHRNTQNAKRRSDNSTGYTGINLLTSKYGTQHYVASWKVMKKTHSKSFNIGILGKEKALELAIAYRKEQLSKLNEQGASYTERHGKDGFPN